MADELTSNGSGPSATSETLSVVVSSMTYIWRAEETFGADPITPIRTITGHAKISGVSTYRTQVSILIRDDDND